MAELRFFPLNQGAAGTTEIAAASPGNKHKVLGFMFSPPSSGTRSFAFAGSTSGNLIGAITIQSGGLPTWPCGTGISFCETAIGEALQLVTTGAAFKGVVQFISEP